MEQVKIGKVYRHFKGNYYFVENGFYKLKNVNDVLIYVENYVEKVENLFIVRWKLKSQKINSTHTIKSLKLKKLKRWKHICNKILNSN